MYACLLFVIQRIRLGASPPATQDLVDKYTPRRSPSKLQDSPYRRAVIQARKMYMLDGCHKSEIAEKLSDKLVVVAAMYSSDY